MTGLELLAYQVTRGAMAAVLEHLPQLIAAARLAGTTTADESQTPPDLKARLDKQVRDLIKGKP